MSSSNKERFCTVGKSRRSSPGDSHSSAHHGGFFQAGQGGRPVLPPLSDSFPTSRFSGRFSQCNVVDQPAQPDPLTYTVPAPYSTPYNQPRSAPNKLSYDLDHQAIYGAYTNTSTCSFLLFSSFISFIHSFLLLAPQFPSAFPNYEIHHHERYSPQPSYPTYPNRSTPPIMTSPPDSRRCLPPLSSAFPVADERWPQQAFVPQLGFPATNIRSPTATYPTPNQFMQQHYSPTNQANYNYPMAHVDHVALNSQSHGGLFDDVPRMEPRSNSPYRASGSAQVPPSQSSTPPPNSPTSPEESTVKKKRRRADATQLKVLNDTYSRTAFPSTEERIALAKALDMSARSVQIW